MPTYSKLIALFALANSLPGATAGFSSASNGNVAIYWGEYLPIFSVDTARTTQDNSPESKALTM